MQNYSLAWKEKITKNLNFSSLTKKASCAVGKYDKYEKVKKLP
jgi:hypothetical protein